MSDLPKDALRKGIRDPAKAARFLLQNKKRIYKFPYLAFRSVNQYYYNKFEQPGELEVMSEEWDTLLILDACRYDYFRRISELPGDLESRYSPASMSHGFINESFIGDQFHDTVYVTANPFAPKIPGETFYDVIGLVDEYWENETGTVPPETMRKKTAEAHSEYPNKRIISHFMQPHHPFLSDFGRKLSRNLYWAGNQYHPSSNVRVSDIRQAYSENLKLVLSEIEGLIDDIDGKIVITADHGELLGERLRPIPIRGFEHPESIYTEELLKVPWLTIENGERDTVSETPAPTANIASEAAKSRLEKLGYI